MRTEKNSISEAKINDQVHKGSIFDDVVLLFEKVYFIYIKYVIYIMIIKQEARVSCPTNLFFVRYRRKRFKFYLRQSLRALHRCDYVKLKKVFI